MNFIWSLGAKILSNFWVVTVLLNPHEKIMYRSSTRNGLPNFETQYFPSITNNLIVNGMNFISTIKLLKYEQEKDVIFLYILLLTFPTQLETWSIVND